MSQKIGARYIERRQNDTASFCRYIFGFAQRVRVWRNANATRAKGYAAWRKCANETRAHGANPYPDFNPNT